MDEMDPILNLLNQRPREDWSWNFEPTADGESAVNAVALCNASLLTYSSQTDVQRFLAKWEFEEPHIFRGSSTQGFVARRGEIVVVAFRGTEPINADDWLSDVNYHQRVVDKVPGQLHGGLAKALVGAIDEQMVTAVKQLVQGETTRLFVTAIASAVRLPCLLPRSSISENASGLLACSPMGSRASAIRHFQPRSIKRLERLRSVT